MAVFKFVVSDPKTKKSYSLEADQDKAMGILGKKIGDSFNGDLIGLGGYELGITGGTDKDGFPMNPSVHGPGRKRLVLAGPPTFYPKFRGQRRRKTVRGSALSRDITQVNCKVLKYGKKTLEELLGKKGREEKPAEGAESAK